MVEIMAKETEKKKAEGAYFITTKELAEAGRDNIPEELISSKHLSTAHQLHLRITRRERRVLV